MIGSQRLSLALYAATLDFCALHALTGTHWLRLIAPRTPDRGDAAALFLAGDRGAGAEDGLSGSSERG